MRMKSMLIFAAGVTVGAMFLSPVMARILPSWDKASVKPVVLVKFDNFDTFKPVDDSASFPPTWKLSEVTPMAAVQYQSSSDSFVPLYSNSQMVPAWKKENVTPWVEVMSDTFSDFVPRYSQ